MTCDNPYNCKEHICNVLREMNIDKTLNDIKLNPQEWVKFIYYLVKNHPDAFIAVMTWWVMNKFNIGLIGASVIATQLMEFIKNTAVFFYNDEMGKNQMLRNYFYNLIPYETFIEYCME